MLGFPVARSTLYRAMQRLRPCVPSPPEMPWWRRCGPAPSSTPMRRAGSREVVAVWLWVFHEPARDRLRDTSGPWFRAEGRLGAWGKTTRAPSGRTAGRTTVRFKEATSRADLLQPSAAPLPRATARRPRRGGALPTLGQGQSSGTPSPCAIARCWRDQPAWPARCQGTPPGEDEPGPAARPIHQALPIRQRVPAKHLRRYR